MNARIKKNYIYRGDTAGLCPVCGKIIQSRIHESKNKIYMKKFCPEHGYHTSIISSDASWSEWARAYNKPGEIPLKTAGKVEKGCPKDCGLCQDHEQHSCFIQIEITDKCDLKCPNCYMGPENSWFLPKEKINSMFERIGKIEGNTEVVTLTGGEPSLHPQLFDIIKLGKKNNIKYILLNTNGNRIANDLDFVKKIRDEGLICYLQFDGFKKDIYHRLRGLDLLSIKLQALENLEKTNCPTVLSPVIEKNVNDDQPGEIIRYAVSKKHIKGVNFLPIAYLKKYLETDSCYSYDNSICPDPMNRITHPEMIDLIVKQSQGLLDYHDLIPIPCHHPSCGSATYIINSGNGAVPITRIIKIDSFLDYIKNKARVDSDDIFQALRIEIEKIWSTSAVSSSNKVIDSVKNLLSKFCMCGNNCVESFDDNLTQISVHAFMDHHTWDISRARKCCIHFMLPDGKLIPFCNYNLFYREKYKDLYRENNFTQAELMTPENTVY